MKRIDRLIVKAKRSIGTELILAYVERCGDQWKAQVHLDHKQQGRELEICESFHPTEDAALDHIHAMADKYPNSRDLTIIVDDIADGVTEVTPCQRSA